MLAAIVLGTLAKLTLFSVAKAGPEEYLTGHPLLVVTVIFFQIVVVLGLVGVLANRTTADRLQPAGTVATPHDT